MVEESVGYEGRVGSNAFRESSEGLLKSFIGTEVGDEFRMKPREKWGSRKKKEREDLQHRKEQRWYGYHLGGEGGE